MSSTIGQIIDLQAVRDIAIGATFLGAGGGGATYSTELQLETRLEQGKAITLIAPEHLRDDALVVPCGWLGAPGIQKEKYPSGREAAVGLEKLETMLGRKIDAILPIEIGGQNGINPFILSAEQGIPVVDCDGMGRAFPQANMVTFNIYGLSATPAVASDTHGNCVVFDTDSNATLERLVRPLAMAMGGHCHLFDYPMDGAQVKQYAVPGTVTLAWEIGKAVRRAREQGNCPFEGMFTHLKGTNDYRHVFCLFEGKIVDLERRFSGGFSVGNVTLAGLGGQPDTMEIQFQNENLVAYLNGELKAIVPDIISIVDLATAEAINTEDLKYGQRVRVIVTSVSDLLRSERALKIVGPEAFGLPHPFQPVELLNE